MGWWRLTSRLMGEEGSTEQVVQRRYRQCLSAVTRKERDRRETVKGEIQGFAQIAQSSTERLPSGKARVPALPCRRDAKSGQGGLDDPEWKSWRAGELQEPCGCGNSSLG